MRVEAAVGILICQGKVWVQRRPEAGHLGGYWEFPGGKLKPGESPESALIREIREELGLDLTADRTRFLESVEFAYPDRIVLLYFYLCALDAFFPTDVRGRWVAPADLPGIRLPEANRTIVERILRGGIV
ncbi:MAG TPA: (deoxy)nucleoside triphosphate pyrophosphohydrolase [Acidobacteriota bacterium]|nr:(deoxy)nucleoside triphosphate pyrophosphohydrolase [Acidobacteriota bacterium]